MKLLIKENTWLKRYEDADPATEHGWGNGYVIIPEGHFLHGKHYDILNNFVSVNGGLTYSDICKGWEEYNDGDWVVGFDTCHAHDTLEMWPKEAVLAETEALLNQLKEIDERDIELLECKEFIEELKEHLGNLEDSLNKIGELK